jgi:two-component system sensor histidine kinase SenX3
VNAGAPSEVMMRPAVSQTDAERHFTEDEKAPGSGPGGDTRDAQDNQAVALQRLSIALQELSQGVVITDETGRVAFRNREAETYVAARHSEVLAERAVADLLSRALEGQSVEQVIELFAPPRRTLNVRAIPLVDEGRTIGAVAIVEDISQKQRIDAIRRDFVANISHELKTPVGALSLLAETLDGEADPDTVSRLTERMHTEAERVGRIIEDLLDLSRLEANEATRNDPVPLFLVVSQAIDRLRPLALHREITLEAPEPDHNLVVTGDRLDLVSAVFNLVDNAIKYSEPRSAVQVDVAADPAGSNVLIQVTDHGPGIPARHLERIFERFYRVDRARSRSTGGTGLGLSIVRHVITNHGGTVTVDSHQGTGSVFTISLPRWTPSQ